MKTLLPLALAVLMAGCAASPMRVETRTADNSVQRASALEEGARRAAIRAPDGPAAGGPTGPAGL